MAKLEVEVIPFEVPQSVYLKVPGADVVEIPLTKLDAATAEQLVADFAEAVMAAIGKK